MLKFKITPVSGSILEAKDVSFEISGIDKRPGLRVRFENATSRTPIKFTDGSDFIDIDGTSVKGQLNLNISSHSSDVAISIYAII